MLDEFYPAVGDGGYTCYIDGSIADQGTFEIKAPPSHSEATLTKSHGRDELLSRLPLLSSLAKLAIAQCMKRPPPRSMPVATAHRLCLLHGARERMVDNSAESCGKPLLAGRKVLEPHVPLTKRYRNADGQACER